MFGIRVGRRPSRRLTGADHTRVCFSSYLGAAGRHSGRPAVPSRVGAARPRASDSTPYRRSRSPIPARPADGRRRRAMDSARIVPARKRALTRKGAVAGLGELGMARGSRSVGWAGKFGERWCGAEASNGGQTEGAAHGTGGQQLGRRGRRDAGRRRDGCEGPGPEGGSADRHMCDTRHDTHFAGGSS